MKHTVTEHKLVSGAQGLVIDVPGSAVVNLQVRFDSGFQFADRKRYEVPHVMEHVLATVTQDHPGPNEFIIEAQKKGAYVNASTSVDANGYQYEFADFETERMLGLVTEQITRPLFAQTAMEAELGNVREELTRNTTQHAAVCGVRLAELAYPKLWLDFDERIKQLPEIKIEHLREHFERTHTAANGRFYVAGHFPDGGAGIVRRFEELFGQLSKGKRFERDRSMGRLVAKPVVEQREIQQVYYRVALYFGELTEPERRALTLLRMVLAGGMGSRVLGEARRRGLAYGVGSLGHAEPGNSSFGFAGYVTPQNAEALFELMAREYAQVRAGGVTAGELEAAKDLVIGSIKRQTQTPGDLLGWYMEPYDEDGEIRHFEKTLELLRGVTPGDVAALAAKATAAGRQGTSFVGDLDAARAEHYQELLSPLWQG
jgi:predicted Zn-dependent peptidase